MTPTVRLCIALFAVALLSACSHKKTEAEQLADLDKAYQGGAVTKQEYDAKKAAIAAPSTVADAAPVPAGAIPPPAVTPEPGASSLSTPSAPTDKAEPEPAPAKGCEEAETRTRKDSGPQSRFYPMPLAQVEKAALDAFQTLDFAVHSQDGNEIDASKKRHAGVLIGAGGERVTLQFEEATEEGASGTKVIGATKKGKTGVLAQKSWTTAVLAQIACNLK